MIHTVKITHLQVKGQGVGGLPSARVGDAPLRGGVVVVLAEVDPPEFRRSGVHETALDEKRLFKNALCV